MPNTNTTVSFTFEARNRTEQEFNKLNAQLRQQRAEIQKLRAEERLRAAEAAHAARQSVASAARLNIAQKQVEAQRTFAHLQNLRAKMGLEALDLSAAKAARSMAGLNAQTSSMGRLGEAFANLRSQGGSAIVALGGLITTGLVAALAAATAGAIALQRAVTGAMDRELQAISMTTMAMRVLNIGRPEAAQLQAQLQTETLRRISPVASTALAQEFNNLYFSDIAAAVGKERSVEAGAEFSTRLSTLMIGREERSQEVQRYIADILQGNISVAQLRGADIFGETGLNKTLLPALEAAGAGEGRIGAVVTDPEQRFRILLDALAGVVTDESMIAQAQTVSGIWSTAMRQLFDPYTGVFGIERDLDPIMAGAQSVFSEFKTMMIALFDRKTGLLSAFGAMFGDFDPMVAFRDSITGLTNWIGSFRDFVLTPFTNAIRGGDANQAAYLFGKAIADSLDWVGTGIYNFVKTTNWGNVARSIGFGIVGFVAEINWIGLLSAIGEGLFAIRATVNNAFISLASSAWTILTEPIARAIFDMKMAVIGAFRAVWQTVENAIVGFVNVIADALKNLTKFIDDRTAGIRTTFTPIDPNTTTKAQQRWDPFGLFQRYILGETPPIQTVPNRASGQIPQAIARELAMAPGTIPVIANSSELILNPKQIRPFMDSVQGSRTVTINMGGVNIGLTNSGRDGALALVAELSKLLQLELQAAL